MSLFMVVFLKAERVVVLGFPDVFYGIRGAKFSKFLRNFQKTGACPMSTLTAAKTESPTCAARASIPVKIARAIVANSAVVLN